MICPHCQIGTSPAFRIATLGRDQEHRFNTETGNCSECDRIIVYGVWLHNHFESEVDRHLIFPHRVPPRPIPAEVTGEYAEDFREACLVLQDSPKASAAVSRRLVQHIIREKAGITRHNLNQEIDALIESNQLPSDLAEDLDMIRAEGNFGAHTMKDKESGQIVSVAPGEAEALIDLLEELLEFYFVRPAIRARKRAATNEKLARTGKPALKGTAEEES